MFIQRLSTLECTELLASQRVAYLASSNEGRPYVIPIHFAYADHALYAFSMLGKKIGWMRANPLVSVLVEKQGAGRQWQSVIVDGRYEELLDKTGHKHERERAWSLLSKHADWWEPGAYKPTEPPLSDHSPHVFFRIIVEETSGREAKD